MDLSFDEVNEEKWAELRAQLRDVEARVHANHQSADGDVINRGITFAGWAWRMVTALRREVDRLGGDPDSIRADAPRG
jgi:hypothetical protein